MLKRVAVILLLIVAAIMLLLPFVGPPLFGDTDNDALPIRGGPARNAEEAAGPPP